MIRITLYIARDEIFNSLYLHSLKPKFRDKVFSSNGVIIDPTPEILERYKDLTVAESPVELKFILEEKP